MNYLFGSMQREFEYKNVEVGKEKLDRIEELTDILTDLEETMGFEDVDYDIAQGECAITAICDELVVRTTEDRALYDAIEMADRFSCKQISIPDAEDNGISITLIVNV